MTVRVDGMQIFSCRLVDAFSIPSPLYISGILEDGLMCTPSLWVIWTWTLVCPSFFLGRIVTLPAPGKHQNACKIHPQSFSILVLISSETVALTSVRNAYQVYLNVFYVC